MPTKRVDVGLAEVILVEASKGRTAILVANPDATAVLYVSDEKGKGLLGLPVFPQSYIMLSYSEGVETQGIFYIISDTASKYAHVMEFYIIYAAWKPPEPEPPIQDPVMTAKPWRPPYPVAREGTGGQIT